jgi:hypothetical protein
MAGREIQDDLAAGEAVFDWCLRNAQREEAVRNLELSARWAFIAAGIAVDHGHRRLCAPALETQLLRLAGALAPAPALAARPRATPPRRWLHVLSVSMSIGGHTALARRWIARNPGGDRHDLAVTMQAREEVAPALADVVRAAGGTITSVAGGDLTASAAALRALAWRDADVVVLHIHMWDVIPSLALGIPGGPPVLLVNHADHAFWVGCAVSDVVVDIRDSGAALTRDLRAARAGALLPVPLEDHGVPARDRAGVAALLPAGCTLGDGPVLLTIGGSRKYRKHPTLDFSAAAAEIVDKVNHSTLIAVGPRPDKPRWRRLAERTRGRVIAVGERADLAPWHAAADLYLESFPVGSYTALLEVGLAGRAFVRKPWLAPPDVLAIDRGALADFEPPQDSHAYAAQAVALAEDAALRDRLAAQARRAIAGVHCGAAWDARLAALAAAIPPAHDVGLAGDPAPAPHAMRDYAACLGVARTPGAALEAAQRTAERHGLRPRRDAMLLDALRAAGEGEVVQNA